MPRFVLDHNFPIMITGIRWPPDLTLEPLHYYDERLIRDHADWQVLRELDRRGDVDGYISNDAKMLNLAPEMVALHLSGLTLVVTDGVGDDPLAATGLLMTHLIGLIARERQTRGARLYRLRPMDLGNQRENILQLLEKIAGRQNVQRDRLIAEERRVVQAWPGLPPKPRDDLPPIPPPRRRRRT